jgi:hypothetical protein
MRVVLILIGAVMFGLAGGYAWSAMAPARKTPPVHLPKPTMLLPPDVPETASDKQWAARARDSDAPAVQANSPDPTTDEQSVYYSGCNEARAAGRAPLYAGQPGYRPEMDGDGDGVACEPYRGS